MLAVTEPEKSPLPTTESFSDGVVVEIPTFPVEYEMSEPDVFH